VNKNLLSVLQEVWFFGTPELYIVDNLLRNIEINKISEILFIFVWPLDIWLLKKTFKKNKKLLIIEEWVLIGLIKSLFLKKLLEKLKKKKKWGNSKPRY
jgi:deoxyxylulose-5-phosphate synthase